MDTKILREQIGLGNLMACGARDFTVRADGMALRFRVGPKRQCAMLEVELTPFDEYRVRRISMGSGAAKVEEADATCDNVGAVVRRLGDR